MKICGFTFVRNAVKYCYPVVESIKSILPICDQFIVLVGNSEDSTLELIQSIDSEKIKIHHSVWDDSLRRGGKVLAVETDKAFDLISSEFQWAFYLQADELVHEKYHSEIVKTMQQWSDNENVDGLLFRYRHFYGTYNYIADSRTFYRHEIRVIRNNKVIRSFRDAQGFRKNNQKLRVKQVDAEIFHYGWVKSPAEMQKKVLDFQKLWRDENSIPPEFKQAEMFDFSKIDSLQKFEEMHPTVMLKRIESMKWNIELDLSHKKFKPKDKFLYLFEKFTGYRLFEYKNYRLI